VRSENGALCGLVCGIIGNYTYITVFRMGVVGLSAGTRACLAEEFRSFSHSLPTDFRIVPDYASAAALCIISHTWFTSRPIIDTVTSSG
jgi:hypothetical protein